MPWTWYHTYSHYPDTDPTNPCPVLIMPSAWPGSINFKVNGLTRPGFEPRSFGLPDLPKWEMGALLWFCWSLPSWQHLRIYQNGSQFVTVCTRDDFIVLPHWATITKTQDHTQSHYLDTVLSTLSSILVLLSARLRNEKCSFCKSLVWLDLESNWWLSAWKAHSLHIQPPCLVARILNAWLVTMGTGVRTSSPDHCHNI